MSQYNSSHKRPFEGSEYGHEFTIKRPAVTAEAQRAGTQFSQPKIFEQPQLDNYGEPMTVSQCAPAQRARSMQRMLGSLQFSLLVTRARQKDLA